MPRIKRSDDVTNERGKNDNGQEPDKVIWNSRPKQNYQQNGYDPWNAIS
ncbi:MAG: hypothetical protein ABSC55_29040 [Syntrophorhabdales bacterium]